MPKYVRAFIVVAMLLVAAACSSPTAEKSGGSGEKSEPPATDSGLYPNRPDRQKEDKEVGVGQGVELSGYTATLNAATFQPQLSEFEQDGYLVADVQILNRDEKAQPYNMLDWKLQSPGGTVKDPTFGTLDGLLQSGDLVNKGSVSGKIVFEVGAEKGDFFVIYKPDAFDAARGIWKATA